MNEGGDVGPDAIAAEQTYLYRYALARVRDSDLALDIVQDTIVAAMEASAGFQGRSSLRTWLITILRNKIVDAVKARGRSVSLEPDPREEGSIDDDIGSRFATDGHWAAEHKPAAWANPESALENTQFWTVFERCLEHVPPRTAEVFVLREVLGETIPDICKILDLSASNCSVMLYRARMRLKDCLDVNWFSGTVRRDA
jgi:RNA polymerase sigma-70 factor (ECF subfamily)